MNFLRQHKIVNIALVSFLLLYPLYSVIFGINMTDTGYWLSNYKEFFDDTVRGYAVWLSLFFGGTINIVFGKFGLISFKIVNILTIYAILLLIYKLLREYTTHSLLLLFLSMTVIFVNIDLLSILNPDILTTLFFILASYFLYYALTYNRLSYFFIAGLFLGLNIFIRLPNLLGIGLIVIIFFYDFATSSIKKRTFKKSATLLSGYIVSIIIIFLLMESLGHFETYIETIKNLFTAAKDPNYHHSTSGLLTTFITQHSIALLYGLFAIAFILTISWLTKYLNYSKPTFYFAVFIISSITVIYLFKKSSIFNYMDFFYPHLAIVGTIYLSLIFIIIKNYKNNINFSLLALIALFVIILIPLGSNTGLKKSFYGMYLGLPIIFIYISSLTSFKIGQFIFTSREITFLKYYIYLTFILFSLIISTMFFASYGDARAKWNMCTTIKHNSLQYNLTTKDRAISISGLLNTLQAYEKEYDFLFTYERIPIIQYASNLKPFINNSQPFYDMPHILKKKIENSFKTKSLPVVVRAIGQTTCKEWPKNSNSFEKKHVKESRKIIRDFLSFNNYIVVWKNNAFEILLPKTINKGIKKVDIRYNPSKSIINDKCN